jgi:superfamily II DNA or RNA helicase
MATFASAQSPIAMRTEASFINGGKPPFIEALLPPVLRTSSRRSSLPHHSGCLPTSGRPASALTSLGKRGYSIPKDALSEKELQKIREDLTIRPKTMSAVIGNGSEKSYYAFRESSKKIYVPRFYGIQCWGPPQTITLPEGEDILPHLKFQGELRPHQIPVVNAYMNLIKESPSHAAGLLELACGFGKTILAIHIISLLRKKTLIIVNKEFLMNQWIERLAEHLPGARIGKIQGPKVEIQDKDIVIGMLQSIAMKDYPPDTFDSVAVVIIDECHHISSEVFSNALFKIVTRYMLSLSATLTRADGTRYVIEYFLGKAVFTSTMQQNHQVVVRAIEYRNDRDREFNECLYDYKGMPAYSSMITKVCTYRPRTEFIVRIIEDLLKERPDKQIMVICHQIALLKLLLELLTEQFANRGTHACVGISSTESFSRSTAGLYIGGMKQSELDATAGKQVVLCSFALAQEGLDISTLSTLVMISSKVDVVQTVGRILRKKGEQKIIVDLVDPHDIFKNQWNRRKAYFKKCQYDIYMTDSTRYTDMDMTNGCWRLIYSPTGATTRRCGGKRKASEDEDDDDDDDDDGAKPKCLIDPSMLLL